MFITCSFWDKLKFAQERSRLTNCLNYFFKFIKDSQSRLFNVIALRRFPSLLRFVYLPSLLKTSHSTHCFVVHGSSVNGYI